MRPPISGRSDPAGRRVAAAAPTIGAGSWSRAGAGKLAPRGRRIALGEVYRRLPSAGRASELPDPPLTDPAKRAIANVVQRLQVPRGGRSHGKRRTRCRGTRANRPVSAARGPHRRVCGPLRTGAGRPGAHAPPNLFPLPRSGGVSEIVPAASQTLQLLMQADGAEQFLFAGVVRVSGDAPSTHALYTLGRFGPTWECWRRAPDG